MCLHNIDLDCTAGMRYVTKASLIWLVLGVCIIYFMKNNALFYLYSGYRLRLNLTSLVSPTLKITRVAGSGADRAAKAFAEINLWATAIR
jgi:hypothetical protein